MPLLFNLKEEIFAWKQECGTLTTAKGGNQYWKIGKEQRYNAMVQLLTRLKSLGAVRDTILGQNRAEIAKSCIIQRETKGLSKKAWQQRFQCSLEDLDNAKVAVFGRQSDDILQGKINKITTEEKSAEELEAELASEEEFKNKIDLSSPAPMAFPDEPPPTPKRNSKEFDQSILKDRPLSLYEEDDEDFLALLNKKDK